VVASDWYSKSIGEAKRLQQSTDNATHDLVHVRSVLKTALRISKGFPSVDPRIIKVAVWWHDVGRLRSEEHDQLSAKMAKDFLKSIGTTEDIYSKVYFAIHKHTWSPIEPETIEGKIIRDADKLDFLSLSRWKNVIKKKHSAYLAPFAKKVPHLRNEMLSLEVSKTLYDEMLAELKRYLRKCPKWEELEEVKRVVFGL
jgi:HD superfamily phosphodiesterase